MKNEGEAKKPVQTILVVRLSALGDVIFTLPVLSVLKALHPEARMTWVVEDKAATLLLDRSDLDRVVVYPRKEVNETLKTPLRWPRLASILWKHLQALRAERYDLVLDFQGNLKSGLHTLLSRGRRKRGFARGYVKECSHLFTREHVVPPEGEVHRIERAVSLVDPAFPSSRIPRPSLHLSPACLEAAARAVEQVRPRPGPLMVMHPGTSSFGAFKRWAPEKFGRLAAQVEKARGLLTLLTWGPGERALVEAAAKASGGAAFPSPPSRSLLELAAYIRLGTAWVSADSGPLHLANYLGLPCVALFGPKDPALYRPYFPPYRVVRTGVECSPCTKRKCDDPVCMKELEVEPVFQALIELLDGAHRKNRESEAAPPAGER